MTRSADSSPDLPRRPNSDAGDLWIAYWQATGQSWRREPEIGEERQRFLSRRLTHPETWQGQRPFHRLKLGRGDIEWLLANQVLWACAEVRGRLDLRDADLSRADLRGLDRTMLALTDDDLSKGDPRADAQLPVWGVIRRGEVSSGNGSWFPSIAGTPARDPDVRRINVLFNVWDPLAD